MRLAGALRTQADELSGTMHRSAVGQHGLLWVVTVAGYANQILIDVIMQHSRGVLHANPALVLL
jgi:hypothetical protein